MQESKTGAMQIAPETAKKGEQREKFSLESVANAVDGVMNKSFERIGVEVATNPWRTIFATLFFFVLSILGAVFSFETESRGEKLWIPQDTQALDDQEVYESYFPSESRRNVVIMEERSGELFSKEGFETIMGAFNDIEAITINFGGETLDFQDICEPGTAQTVAALVERPQLQAHRVDLRQLGWLPLRRPQHPRHLGLQRHDSERRQ
eukprot:scaffold2963_cov250-Pinguiococcus_pyrenoidosus.AAC.10